ncbi:MAG TPA: helix-turn-helix transcriptional regulator [Kofleriaceae bacterium]|nr:helix-turn-helix transcriptional regulator [Kofleriaceae bacterium]
MTPRRTALIAAFRPTELSQLVATGRRNKRLKQSELEKRLGLTPQYVSKVERGAIRRPPDDVLQKLADFLERDIADLRDACGRDVDRVAVGATSEGRRFQIVMGHTVWAAPALLALRHSDFAPFEFASFGPHDGPPRWQRAGVDDPPTIPPPSEAAAPGAARERTYSARDVSAQLRLGRGDFGLLPRAFVTDGGDLEPIVDLMDSPSACLVSLPTTLCGHVEEGSSVSVSTVVDLLKTLKARVHTSKRKPQITITILAEAETVAEDHAFVMQKALLEDGFLVDMPPSVRCSEFSEYGEFDAFAKVHNLTADQTVVIGWDPPMTWLHRPMRDRTAGRRLFPLRSDDPATRVRFALVASKSRLLDPPVALLWRFVEEVEKAGNVVRGIMRADPSADRNAARFLTRYFRLGDDRAAPSDLSLLLRRTLGYLDFCAHPSVRFFGPFFRSALG